MATPDELRQMDIDAGRNRLADIKDQLEALKQNPEISQYAAEEYIDESVSSLNAAIVDLQRADEEVD